MRTLIVLVVALLMLLPPTGAAPPALAEGAEGWESGRLQLENVSRLTLSARFVNVSDGAVSLFLLGETDSSATLLISGGALNEISTFWPDGEVTIQLSRRGPTEVRASMSYECWTAGCISGEWTTVVVAAGRDGDITWAVSTSGGRSSYEPFASGDRAVFAQGRDFEPGIHVGTSFAAATLSGRLAFESPGVLVGTAYVGWTARLTVTSGGPEEVCTCTFYGTPPGTYRFTLTEVESSALTLTGTLLLASVQLPP